MLYLNIVEALLTYISKKLKIDAHYLYKGFFWIIISTVVVVLANLLKSTAFAHFLRPETFGTYRYVMTIVEIASTFGLTGASYVISRSVAQGFEGSYRKGMQEYLKHSWLSVMITSSIAGYYFYQESYLLGTSIGLAGLFTPFVNTFRLYSALLEGKKMNILNSKYQIFSSSIPAILLIFVVTKTSSIFIIITTYFVSFTALHFFLMLLTNKIINPNNNIDPKAKGFTFHLSLMGVLATVTENIDKILLFQFIGPAQLAAYSFASALPEQFNILGKGLRTLIYPKISNQSITSIKKHMPWRIFLIFIASLFMFLSYVIFAPLIFKIFFPRYVDSVFLSQVYSLSIFLIIAIPYKLTLFANSCTKQLYQSKIITMALRLVSLAILLPLFGIWGVIISYLLSRFTETFILMFMVHFVISDDLKTPNLI